MKTRFLYLFILALSVGVVKADVEVIELNDRIRVEIDGKLFTEWRHKEWLAPYLYPVIGPNGEAITRHYPMKNGVPHEAQDHPHHRSLRFAHSDVNGLNFWAWRPGKEREFSNAEIKLEKIEKLSSGKEGEFVVWNRWLDGDKLVLRERMSIKVIPLKNRQVLMDYDVKLIAGDKSVTFGDNKDGGMYVRVAGTMKVKAHRAEGGEAYKGTILNSRGNRNADAWGKRAEWIDYFGPDASGKTVGIAMFDHPDNLRFPTHWHARDYGLLAANRFGADHFDPKYKAPKGVSCRPYGNDCPACNSRGGNYTIAAGESLNLRHRFYFHHGDTKVAQVAKHYANYSREEELDKNPNKDPLKVAGQFVEVSVTPPYQSSFDRMKKGVIQHLDRKYTYDVIPSELKNGLLFQGIHRPPKGTSVKIKLLSPAKIYFFFHHTVDGGYSEIFSKLKGWKRADVAPQYDIHNGDHGLKMVMYEMDAKAGTYEIPPTTKDRACFNIVFQAGE